MDKGTLAARCTSSTPRLLESARSASNLRMMGARSPAAFASWSPRVPVCNVSIAQPPPTRGVSAPVLQVQPLQPSHQPLQAQQSVTQAPRQTLGARPAATIARGMMHGKQQSCSSNNSALSSYNGLGGGPLLFHRVAPGQEIDRQASWSPIRSPERERVAISHSPTRIIVAPPASGIPVQPLVRVSGQPRWASPRRETGLTPSPPQPALPTSQHVTPPQPQPLGQPELHLKPQRSLSPASR